jgi:hypothetical protein
VARRERQPHDPSRLPLSFDVGCPWEQNRPAPSVDAGRVDSSAAQRFAERYSSFGEYILTVNGKAPVASTAGSRCGRVSSGPAVARRRGRAGRLRP